MNIITKEMCVKVWQAFNEIDVAKKLIEDCEKALKEGQPPVPNDNWGREQNFHMSLPSTLNSRSIVKVNPRLALAILKNHISENESELVALNEEIIKIYAPYAVKQ